MTRLAWLLPCSWFIAACFSPAPKLPAEDSPVETVLPPYEIRTVEIQDLAISDENAEPRVVMPCDQLAAGESCDLDNNPCTIDRCDGAGQCVAGTRRTCERESAEEPCWTFACNDTGACAPARFDSGGTCDDSDACTQEDRCSAELRKCAGTRVDVDDGNPCTIDICTDGLPSHDALPDGEACPNGGMCANSWSCKEGICTPELPECDDGLWCTIDTCGKEAGQCASLIAEDACAIDGACHAAGAAHPTTSCLVCDPLMSRVSWTPSENGTNCDDGNACTLDDRCNSDGACEPGADAGCLNALPCAALTCDSEQGCVLTVDPAYCVIEGSCVLAHASDAENSCWTCDPSVSQMDWSPMPDGVVCAEAEPCGTPPTCDGAGACDTTESTACDDGDPCTLDVCDPLHEACTHTPTDGPTCWSVADVSTDVPLHDVWGDGDGHVVAVGADCTILEVEANQWQAVPIDNCTGGDFLTVWGDGGDLILAGGIGANAAFQNGSGWGPALLPDPTLELWGDGAGMLFAVQTTKLLKWTPALMQWVQFNSAGLTGDLTALTKCQDALWVVDGLNGAIFQFNGVFWGQAYAASAGLRDVTCTVNGILYAVGDAGTIVRFDGESWTEESAETPSDVFAVADAGAFGVYAVGEAGTILHRTDEGWKQEFPGISTDLYAVWSDPTTGTAWAVGSAGIVVHKPAPLKFADISPMAQ